MAAKTLEGRRKWWKEYKIKNAAILTEKKSAIRAYLWEYKKTHPCVDCREPDPVVLEFDHRDSLTKKFTLAAAPYGVRHIDSVIEEVLKCDIRCANCHRRRTYRQRQNKELRNQR